ncbi:MAK10-like protein [Tanacetum coccineum]
MAMVRKGKQRGHIPEVGRVLAENVSSAHVRNANNSESKIVLAEVVHWLGHTILGWQPILIDNSAFGSKADVEHQDEVWGLDHPTDVSVPGVGWRVGVTILPLLIESIFSSYYLFRNPFLSTTMGDENPIRTLGDYSRPSHEGYRNTIELLEGNNVDPNQHLKDFLKQVDSLDLDGENRERIRLRLFQFSLRDQASNWLERLLAGSISTWEYLTTRFLAQFFPWGRTSKLRNDILMFQQHHEESLSKAWTRFKDLLQKVPHHGIDLWLQNDPRDFAKPVKAIALPQDVPSTSVRRLIELKNQVQHLMEAHLALAQPTQVNKITTLCEICSGPHDTQYCMENPEQAFVEYASSRTDEAGEGLVSEFMASQDARLSRFEADFKRQQGEMTNKIDTVLKAITDQITGTLPSDTVKNPKLGTHPVSSALDEPEIEHEDGNPDDTNSNPQPQLDPFASIATEQVRKLNSMLESLGLVPQSSNTKFVCTKEDDGEVMFIEIIRDEDEPQNERTAEGPAISCNIGHVHIEKAYIDLNSPLNIMTRMMYNWIMRRKLNPREDANGGISNFTGRIKGMHVFIGNFTYLADFMIVEDISSIIDPRLSNEEDKRRGVEYVMSKILGFYKECLELGPEYLTGVDDEGEVT